MFVGRAVEEMAKARKVFGVRLCRVGVLRAWALISYPTSGAYEDWSDHLYDCRQCNQALGKGRST